ncbi:hypothetical protein [Clostridium hydrogenum]|uniref:hypothetical protein n=1 Tax=Clostridium hydrogenum TaxID=2855764 RepID=UPI001F4001AE|nr:hypothetical protein [Clostridium hydrogenum]
MKSMYIYDALIDIKKIIFTENNLLDKYNKLINSLNYAINRANKLDIIKEPLNDFYSANDKIERELRQSYSEYYKKTIEVYEINKIVGDIFCDELRIIIENNGVSSPNTINTLIAQLSSNSNRLNLLLTELNKIIELLNVTREIQYGEFKKDFPEKFVLEFKINNEVRSIDGVKNNIDMVDKIAKNFARLTEEISPEKNIVYSLDDGSVILGLVITHVSLLAILQCVTEFYKIKKVREEFKREFQKNILFKELSDELKEKIRQEKEPKVSVENLTNILMTEFYTPQKGENENELNTLINKTIKDIGNIIENNGQINVLKESKDEILLEASGNEEFDKLKQVIEDNNKAIKELKDYKKYINKLDCNDENIKRLENKD